MMTVKSASPAQTKQIGKKLAVLLDKGDVIALDGDLGAGKTTLVKGIAQGLGVANSNRAITSPTFTLVNHYKGRLDLYHLDWYRLKKVKLEDRLIAEECLYSEGVTVLEWAVRGKEILPKAKLEVKITHGGEGIRMLAFRGVGKRYALLEKQIGCMR